jgi:hypothetical protein
MGQGQHWQLCVVVAIGCIQHEKGLRTSELEELLLLSTVSKLRRGYDQFSI